MTKSNSSGSIVSLATAAVVSVSGLAVVTTALWWNHRAQSKPSVDQRPNDSKAEARLTNDGPVQEIQWTDNDIRETDGDSKNSATFPRRRILSRGCVTIVHGSVTGTCAKFATSLYDAMLRESSLRSGNGAASHVQIGSTEDFDWWDELINDENETITPSTSNTEFATLIIVLPTYTNGTWPPVATGLQEALQELQNDWRIAAKPVKNKLQAAVFGMGSSAYNSGPSEVSTASKEARGATAAAGVPSSVNNIVQPAKEATKALQKLGAKVLARLAIGDDAVGNHANETFAVWQASVLQQLYGRPKSLSQKAKNAACACSTESAGGDTTTAGTGCCQAQSTETGNQSDVQKSEEKNTSCCNSEEEAENYDDFDNFATKMTMMMPRTLNRTLWIWKISAMLLWHPADKSSTPVMNRKKW
jgi:sulfite reductase alpha subunit-like flavoprotein